MSAPLPKVYEDCGNGTAQPISTTQGLSGAIGGDFKVDELQRVSKETVRFLSEVILHVLFFHQCLQCLIMNAL